MCISIKRVFTVCISIPYVYQRNSVRIILLDAINLAHPIKEAVNHIYIINSSNICNISDFSPNL